MASILYIGPDWAYFYFKVVEFILLLNYIPSFVLEIAFASSGVGVCKAGYIGHDYIMFVGMLGRK